MRKVQNDTEEKEKLCRVSRRNGFHEAATVRIEYDLIVEKLEAEGRLSMPEGEKIAGENLFAIRVIRAGNVRIFYVYGVDDFVYGIHAYVKKTRQIPKLEITLARKLAKALKNQEGTR